MTTLFHADDFGIAPEQSQRILDLCTKGENGADAPLTSTSLMVNSPFCKACASTLVPLTGTGGVKVGLHVNVVEGPCCAEHAEDALLVDAHGMFRLSFAGLLALSAGRRRAQLLRELTEEISAQIDRFLTMFPNQQGCLRVDGHQHTHLIPVVFDALLSAVDARGCTLAYLRVPAEPVGPYLTTASLYRFYPPVNFVKNALLNVLWLANKRKLPEYRRISAVFCGLILSGRMEHALTGSLLERFQALAKRRGMDLEVLFHPGGIDNAADCLDARLSGFVDFYQSPHRRYEAEALESFAASKSKS